MKLLEALELNVKLHAVLKVLVKGSKEALLQQQNCGGSSYVHAVICLHKHMILDKGNRKAEALNHMLKLNFNGNPQKWETEALKRISEVVESKVTVHDMILHCLRKSVFEKSKISHAMISQVVNGHADTSRINLYDLIHKVTMQLNSTTVSERAHMAGAGNNMCRAGCGQVYTPGHEKECSKRNKPSPHKPYDPKGNNVCRRGCGKPWKPGHKCSGKQNQDAKATAEKKARSDADRAKYLQMKQAADAHKANVAATKGCAAVRCLCEMPLSSGV